MNFKEYLFEKIDVINVLTHIKNEMDFLKLFKNNKFILKHNGVNIQIIKNSNTNTYIVQYGEKKSQYKFPEILKVIKQIIYSISLKNKTKNNDEDDDYEREEDDPSAN